MSRIGLIGCLLLLAAAVSSHRAHADAASRPTTHWVLHLCGVGGELECDHRLLRNLRRTVPDATMEIYDWTENDSGVNALHAPIRNHKEAQIVADRIAAHFAADPAGRIDLIGHSAGCGIAAWALEKLPDKVMVENVIMLAPALSKEYDLSAALRHVRGKVYVFSSLNDGLVLSTGTQLLGTVDGVKGDAAGYSGFVRPGGADEAQYRKIVPCPYQDDWIRLGDSGDHIGATMAPFVRKMLAPLLEITDRVSLPVTRPVDHRTTQPAESSAAPPAN